MMNRDRCIVVFLGLSLGLGLSSGPAFSAPQAADPELDQSLFSSIDALAANMLAEVGGVGFSVAIARHGEILYARGYGHAEVEHDVAAKGNTMFRIGSITKQFTAAAIMRLIEQGKLSLDDELSQFFPDFPTQGHTVTIRHLLTHTSGIKSYTGVDAFWQTSVARELTVEELLDFVKDEPFEFEPGEKFAYNNTAYYMLGPIIEQASGMSYCDYLQHEFFDPLELTRTRCDSNSDIIPNRAQGYGLEEGRLVNDGLIGMDNPGAAGMLLSTARDLVNWNMALMYGQVVSAESLRQMITPYTLPDGEDTGYGFGLGMVDFHGHRRISHGGGIYGFNSMLMYYPVDEVYIAVISNGTASAGDFATEIAMRMLGIERKVTDIPQTPEELERMCGLYVMTRLGHKIRVWAKEDGLYMQAKDQPEFKLLNQGNGEYLASFDTVIKIVFDISTTDGPCPSFIFHQGGQRVWAFRQEDEVED